MSDLVKQLSSPFCQSFSLSFRKNTHDHDVSVAKENIANFEAGVSRETILDLFIQFNHNPSGKYT